MRHFLPAHSLAAEPPRSPSAWSPGCNLLQSDTERKVVKDNQELRAGNHDIFMASVFVCQLTSQGVVLASCFHNEPRATFPGMFDGESELCASRGFHNK